MKQDFEEISARRRTELDSEILAQVEAQVEADFALLQIAVDLKRARREAQLTQVQLAAKTGITQSEISRIEKGRYSPRLSTLFMLAQALKTDFVIPGTSATSTKVA